jgi:outer membrane protein TolC
MHGLFRIRLKARLVLAIGLATAGCSQTPRDAHYLGEPGTAYYKGHATEVAFPNVAQPTPEEVAFSLEPHTVREREHFELRPLSLSEAVCIALQNAQIVRTAGQFLSPGNSLLANPNGVTSVYDPAINESGVLFGNRGVEAALAAFDATFTSSMIWGGNETVQNNLFLGGGLGGGSVLKQETAQFQSALQKSFAYGGTVQLQHNVNYFGTNSPGTLFGSSYTGNIAAVYRQPLLAGAGTEYTRIAGPIAQSFGGISGVSQGVVIARINSDISVAQFESVLHVLVNDVENAYWDLYLAYRNFNTAATARDSAQGTWELADKQAPAILLPADEAQARDQLFAARSAVLNTRSEIFTAETRLRRLLNLPVNDGTILQPIDEPVSAEIVPDWYASMTEALTNRVELRQQKWNIKSLELQLSAAHSLTRPRLDFVSSAQVNGFGDQLLDYKSGVAGTPPRLQSFYDTIAAGDETGWNVGFEFNMPIGFRQAHAQVRNYELRLAKARKVLNEQEKEIAHELAVAFQEVARSYTTAVENFNRYQAAADNVEKLRPAAGATLNVDVVLRAQLRRADAEIAYFTSLVEYNKALANLQYRKGLILAYNNVAVREGPWVAEAYAEADRRAEARAFAFDAPWKETEPAEFVTPGPVGAVHFATENAARELNSEYFGEPVPEGAAPPVEMQPAPESQPADVPPPGSGVDPFAPKEPPPVEAQPDTGITPVGWFGNRSRLWE